jgi:hypothetical protein
VDDRSRVHRALASRTPRRGSLDQSRTLH